MIKHIVMWNLKGDTPDEKATSVSRLKAAFEGLVGRIPGLLHLEIGVDTSGVDYACDVVLYSNICGSRRSSATCGLAGTRWITSRRPYRCARSPEVT
jgi:hypothetical protein